VVVRFRTYIKAIIDEAVPANQHEQFPQARFAGRGVEDRQGRGARARIPGWDHLSGATPILRHARPNMTSSV